MPSTLTRGLAKIGDQAMSNEPIRTAIWNEMVDTDRLARCWRIVFRFEGRDVRDVDLTDYH